MATSKRGAFLQSGQAGLIAVLFFLFISLIVLGSFTSLSVTQLQTARELLVGKKSYMTAESGVEDAIYRINNGKNYENSASGSTKILTLDPTLLNGGNTTQTSIDNPLPSQFNVTSKAAITSRYRIVTTQFMSRPTNAPGFPSAMMAGFLGIKLSNNTCVYHTNETDADCNSKQQGSGPDHGNVMTNGNIISEDATGDFISGGAAVARTTANLISYAQVNWPENRTTIRLGDLADNSHDYAAQSFIPSETAPIARVDLYLSYQGADPPPAITIKIHPNDPSGGVDKPRTTYTLAQKTLNANDYSNWNSLVERDIELNISGTAEDYRTAYENELYWIVLYANDGNLGSSKYFETSVAADDEGYTSGQRTCYRETWCNPRYGVTPFTNPNSNEELATLKYSLNLASWTEQGRDMAFRVYVGNGTTAPNGTRITRAAGVETGGDVVAEGIRNSTVGTYGGVARYKYIDGTVIAGNNPATPCTDSSTGTPCFSNTNYWINTGIDTDILEPGRLITVYGCGGWWQNCIVASMKAQASAGWQTGSLTLNNTSATKFGSGKISGDLTIMKNNGMLEITKAQPGDPDPVIWITGEGTLRDGQCTIKVKYPAQTATLIFDGKVTLANNCRLIGTNQSGAIDPNRFVYVYSLFYDTGDNTEPASTISLNNNVNQNDLNGVYFAPFGEIRLDGSPRTIALSAARINTFNNSKVVYNSGVAQPTSQGGSTALIPVFSMFRESE